MWYRAARINWSVPGYVKVGDRISFPFGKDREKGQPIRTGKIISIKGRVVKIAAEGKDGNTFTIYRKIAKNR